MGRISEKNPGYRTKDQMATDLAYVLASPLSIGTKRSVINGVAWAWSEFHGKYHGCPYWTRAALHSSASMAAADNEPLRHEHAVPRAVLMDMLLRMEQPTETAIRDFCDRFILGVVVTKSEARYLDRHYRRTMPPAFFDPSSPEHLNPWLRYTTCGVEVIEPKGVETLSDTDAGPGPDARV